VSRNPRKLRVFVLADELAVEIYRVTSHFPTAGRFGLQSQIRRAAVSAATNIVESARRTTKDYLTFLNVSAGSAAETAYLLDFGTRLGLLGAQECDALSLRYTELLKGLLKLILTLEQRD
jgi:four helix bundle protein